MTSALLSNNTCRSSGALMPERIHFHVTYNERGGSFIPNEVINFMWSLQKRTALSSTETTESSTRAKAPVADSAKTLKKEEPVIKRLPPSVVKDIEKKNIARKLAGLSPIVIKVRRCISCGSMFESAGNRTCGCTSRSAGVIAGREIIM